MSKNGKGDSPRNCQSEDYRNNYDQIKWLKRSKKKQAKQPITLKIQD